MPLTFYTCVRSGPMHLVVAPGALVFAAVREDHGATATLLILFPLPFIKSTVLIFHAAIAMLLSPLPVASVEVAILELTHS